MLTGNPFIDRAIVEGMTDMGYSRVSLTEAESWEEKKARQKRDMDARRQQAVKSGEQAKALSQTQTREKEQARAAADAVTQALPKAKKAKSEKPKAKSANKSTQMTMKGAPAYGQERRTQKKSKGYLLNTSTPDEASTRDDIIVKEFLKRQGATFQSRKGGPPTPAAARRAERGMAPREPAPLDVRGRTERSKRINALRDLHRHLHHRQDAMTKDIVYHDPEHGEAYTPGGKGHITKSITYYHPEDGEEYTPEGADDVARAQNHQQNIQKHKLYKGAPHSKSLVQSTLSGKEVGGGDPSSVGLSPQQRARTHQQNIEQFKNTNINLPHPKSLAPPEVRPKMNVDKDALARLVGAKSVVRHMIKRYRGHEKNVPPAAGSPEHARISNASPQTPEGAPRGALSPQMRARASADRYKLTDVSPRMYDSHEQKAEIHTKLYNRARKKLGLAPQDSMSVYDAPGTLGASIGKTSGVGTTTARDAAVASFMRNPDSMAKAKGHIFTVNGSDHTYDGLHAKGARQTGGKESSVKVHKFLPVGKSGDPVTIGQAEFSKSHVAGRTVWPKDQEGFEKAHGIAAQARTRSKKTVEDTFMSFIRKEDALW